MYQYIYSFNNTTITSIYYYYYCHVIINSIKGIAYFSGNAIESKEKNCYKLGLGLP